MANDSIQTGGPPYPNFQWPYPTGPSTGIQLFEVGSDAPHWIGGHKRSQMNTGQSGPIANGAGGVGAGLGHD
jgi:hypothetical protein